MTHSDVDKARQTEFAVHHHCLAAWIFRFSQKISDFRLYIATIIWHFGLAPSSAAVEGRGFGDRMFESSVSHTLILI